ncbi:unnamed protein product [Lathyrus sativus]|nr:unnamed protein product [Lathyrus sativus]
MARIKKRKITSKLIENFSKRKMCYKTRLKGLFTKMEQVTTLCDVQACAVVFGPGDTTPSMWPSRDAAEKLIHEFDSMPEYVRFKNVTDQLSFLKEKGKKLQATLDKIKEDNEDTLMGSYLYQIENEGKPLSDFQPSVLNRLINFMLKKYKLFSHRVENYEEDVSYLNNPSPPRLPPISCSTDYEINRNEQMLNQQPLLDLVTQSDRMISDFDNSICSSMRPSPHENLNNGDMLGYQNDFEVFGGFNNNAGVGDMLAYQSEFDVFGGFHNIRVPPHECLSGGDNMFLTQGNLGGFDSHTSGGVGMSLALENFEGFNNIGNTTPHENHSVGDNMVIPQGDLQGLYNNDIGITPYLNPNVRVGEVYPERKFEDFNGEDFEGFEAFPLNTFGIHNEAIPTNDGRGMDMSMPLNFYEDNNNGRYMGSFNGNFGNINYGNNFNNRFL